MTEKRKLLTRCATMRARNQGFQQSQRKTNLAKLRKTKLLTHDRKLLTRYAITRHRTRISTKSAQNQSSKVEKNKTTDIEEKTLNPLRKKGTQNQGSQQRQRKTNLAKLRETKQLTQTRKLLYCYSKMGTRN